MTTRRRTATTRTCYSGVSYSITFHTFDNLEFTLDAKYRVTNSLFRAYVTSTAALNREFVPDHICHPVVCSKCPCKTTHLGRVLKSWRRCRVANHPCDGDDPEEATAAIIPTAEPGDCCDEWWNMARTNCKRKVIHGAKAHFDAAMQNLS